jgi:oxamate amidohydrolase
MTDTAVFGHAAVAAPHWPASETGQRVLAQGGNALEATVAMAATLAVTYPHNNSIGGDGFWLVAERNGRVHFIDACGAAGGKATVAGYREAGYDSVPPHGPMAALTVPGAVSGWRLALEMSAALGGTLPLRILLEDAIGHARHGVPVSSSQARIEPAEFADLLAAPGFAETFSEDGKPFAAGRTMTQPALGATLEQLAHAGLEDFYHGDIAREMAADLDRLGSPILREDLRRHEARLRPPLTLAIQGARLYSSPPPTQGLAALMAMGIFERLGVTRAESFAHIHGLIESVKPALAVRDRVITDPTALASAPEDYLTLSRLEEEAASVSMSRAAPAPRTGDKGDTVWIGAIDRDGLAVSYIQSVFWDFGSGVVLPSTGIVMQNRGVSFSLDHAALNPLTPGRKPFHTLVPAIAMFDDGRVMPYGTMGGDSQPQIQAQVLSRYRLGIPLADAVDAPRFRLGRRKGDPEVMLRLESRFDEGLVRSLSEAGHPVLRVEEPYSDDFGHAGALVRHRRDGRIEATHDPRSDGGALGL